MISERYTTEVDNGDDRLVPVLRDTRLNTGRACCSTALYRNSDDVVTLIVVSVTGCTLLLSATDINKQQRPAFTLQCSTTMRHVQDGVYEQANKTVAA